MRSRLARIALLVAALAAFAVALVVPGFDVGVLFLSPAIVLLALLVLGYRPGEQIIERLRRPADGLRPRRAPRTVAVRRALTVVPRTAWLPASALAMRPPPVSPAPIS